MKMQIYLLALFIVVATISGCKKDCSGYLGCPIDVEFTDEAWRVSGEVVDADTGQGLPHQVVQFIQLERRPRWCPFCPIHGRNFYLITDERGRFYFSGQISGQLDVLADPLSRGGYCSESASLGEMQGQRKHLKLALKRRPCMTIVL